MGNSKLANGCQHPSAPGESAPGSNGILGQVRGDVIAAAADQMPAPDPFGPELSEIEADGGHLGPVRIFFELRKIRHHKHSHWIWSAYRAEPVHDGRN